MDPVLVQFKSALQGSGLSVSVTLDSDPVPGNALIAVFKDNTNVSVITPESGFAWLTGTPYAAGVARQMGVAAKEAVSGDDVTVTFASDVTAKKEITVYEVENLDLPEAFVVLTDATGGSVTSRQLVTTGVLPKPECFVVAVSEQSTNNGGEGAAPAGFTARDWATFNSYMPADKITTVDTALAPTFTWTTARGNFGMQAVFPALDDAPTAEPDVYVFNGTTWVPHYTMVL